MLKCQEEEKNKFSDCEDASDMDSNEEGEDESSDTCLRNSSDVQEDEFIVQFKGYKSHDKCIIYMYYI